MKIKRKFKVHLSPQHLAAPCRAVQRGGTAGDELVPRELLRDASGGGVGLAIGRESSADVAC